MTQALCIWLLATIACACGGSNELISLPQCITNYDCDKEKACIDLTCKDPCPGVCTGNATCETHDHIPFCACHPGYTGNPFTGCRRQDAPRNCTEACQQSPSHAKKYVIGREQLNWYEALADCFSRGMRLATFENDQEYNHIVYLLKLDVAIQNKTETSFWLSGADLGQNGSYVWMSTGRPVTYTRWYTNEPSQSTFSGEVEHCIEIWGLFNYEMNDARCSLRQWYVCEQV